MRVALLTVAILIIAAIGACQLLPERYAVNAPFVGTLFGADVASQSEFERRMRVPEGFEIEVFAAGIPNARVLRFTRAGDLLVSSPREGSVKLVERDGDGDGRGDEVRTLLQGLDRPHGMDFRGEWLYIAEGAAVVRVRFDHATGRALGEVETVVTGIPEGGNHWTRTLRFGPDGWMYVSIGSTCNACEEEDARRAAILRYRPDGSDEEIYARGLRNAVGFDWQPGTGRLYATDNGRDLLGDDVPPCELNQVEADGFYGWPYLYGDNVSDPDLGGRAPDLEARAIPPAHGFGAHTAPLGIDFYRGNAFPPELHGDAFVALHGSWNRTRKSGYKVVVLDIDPETGAVEESDFVTGFELDEDVIGRPVDVLAGPDGALFISDDYAGAIYRVAYVGG